MKAMNDNAIDVVEVIKVYDYLTAKGKQGAPVLTIARETQLPQQNIKRYLQEFSASFIRIGDGPKYAINCSKLRVNRKKALLTEIEAFNKKRVLGFVTATFIAKV